MKKIISFLLILLVASTIYAQEIQRDISKLKNKNIEAKILAPNGTLELLNFTKKDANAVLSNSKLTWEENSISKSKSLVELANTIAKKVNSTNDYKNLIEAVDAKKTGDTNPFKIKFKLSELIEQLGESPKNINIVVSNALATPLSESISIADPEPVITGGTVDPKNEKALKKDDDQEKIILIEAFMEENGLFYVGGQSNIIYDRQGIIHIFLDEDCQPLYSYYPTTAKSNYDKFQFHFVVSKNSTRKYSISSTGKFIATEIKDDINNSAGSQQSSNPTKVSENFKIVPSPIFGPYTGTFPFTIFEKGNPPTVLSTTKIKLLPTSRVSLNTGVVHTWLQNAENISIFKKPNGDSTLIADNPTNRGLLTAMLTFHLVPRNLNIKPREFRERLGISLGTNLNGKIGDNFFLGVNVEVTNGLFLNGGAHFGQVNYVVNNPDFKFNDDKFSGTLETRKTWKTGFYLSVSVDAGLFIKVFSAIVAPSSTPSSNNQ